MDESTHAHLHMPVPSSMQAHTLVLGWVPSSVPVHAHTHPPHAHTLMHHSPQLGSCLSAPTHAHACPCIPAPSSIHACTLIHGCVPCSVAVDACTSLHHPCALINHLPSIPLVHHWLCTSVHAHTLIYRCPCPCPQLHIPVHAHACLHPHPHMPIPSFTLSLPLPCLCPHPQLFHADHHLIHASHHPLVYLIIVPSTFSPHQSLLFSHHQHAHPQIFIGFVR